MTEIVSTEPVAESDLSVVMLYAVAPDLVLAAFAMKFSGERGPGELTEAQHDVTIQATTAFAESMNCALAGLNYAEVGLIDAADAVAEEGLSYLKDVEILAERFATLPDLTDAATAEAAVASALGD